MVFRFAARNSQKIASKRLQGTGEILLELASMSNFIFKPQVIVRDKRLTPLEQDYLCLIGQLQRAGGCVASNNYFARYFGVKKQSAQVVIGRLIQKGFIKKTEKKQGGKTVERILEITDSDGRNVLLSDGRNVLLSDGRKSSTRLAESSIGVGRKLYTHTIDNTIDNTINTSLTKSQSRNKIDWAAIFEYNRQFDEAMKR